MAHDDAGVEGALRLAHVAECRRDGLGEVSGGMSCVCGAIVVAEGEVRNTTYVVPSSSDLVVRKGGDRGMEGEGWGTHGEGEG